MPSISAEYVDHMGGDESVVNAARVSFAKEANNYKPEQNAKLIQFLAREPAPACGNDRYTGHIRGRKSFAQF